MLFQSESSENITSTAVKDLLCRWLNMANEQYYPNSNDILNEWKRLYVWDLTENGLINDNFALITKLNFTYSIKEHSYNSYTCMLMIEFPAASRAHHTPSRHLFMVTSLYLNVFWVVLRDILWEHQTTSIHTRTQQKIDFA